MGRRQWIKQGGEGKTLTDRILSMRGVKDKDFFLNGTVYNMHDIALMNDGMKAVNIIKESIDKREKIVFYGDYDADGAGGTSVGVMMGEELGGDVSYYINNRFKQGYGMCKSGIDEILELYPDVKLIVTIDNGISALEAADYVKSLGIKLVVTDHHEQGEKLPNADAVVNPKRTDSTYPFNGLCGAVVIWKVLREIYENKSDANKYLDILSISTVGDVVPLVDENRIIVKEGLKLLREDKRLSLKILREMTNTTNINSHFTLAYIYSPIFNAISRLKGEINLVVDFLISDDEGFIRKSVETLINFNEERKALTNIQLEEAEKELSTKGVKEVIVLYNEKFHEGVVGLIAGRLKEKYNRPTFILTKGENGNIKGSARSIEKFDVKKNLDKCSDLLLGYGGHPLAGGLSFIPENLNELENRLIKLAKELLTEEDFIKKFFYVDIINEEDISVELIEELAELEPYGASFEKPLMRLTNFNVRRCFVMGKEEEHIKLVGNNISLLAWRQAKNYEDRGTPLRVSALGYPEINIYNNNVNLQFVVNEDNFIKA